MKIPVGRHAGGIALIMVLMVVTVLAALAGAFAYNMKVETKLAANASWDSELEWIGRSGVEVAKWALSRRVGPSAAFDSLGQAWAGGRMETNESVQAYIGSWRPLGNGEYRITIQDMDRRMNINAADEAVLKQALILVGVDASETPTIVGSIMDWTDRNKLTSPNGAESDYYGSLNPPYKAKDGKLDDISELLMIKGIMESPGIFWGSGQAPAYRQPKSARQSQFEEPVYAVGLRELFCTVSSGRLNINTASAMALQVIPAIDEATAQAILARRRGLDSEDGTEDDTPFRSAQEIATVPGIPPQLVPMYARFLTVQSAVFEVRVETRVGQHRRTFVALVKRSGAIFPTLNLIWEDS